MVFRRRNYLRPVNTIKHIYDEQGGLVAGTQVVSTLVKGVDNPVLASNPNQVVVGSHVRSIFLNIQVAATGTAALANVYMIISGNPGNAIGAQPNANVTGTSDFKKQIFHTEMIMGEKNTTGIPRTLFKGVLKLPRKFGRIGHDDTIQVQLFSPGITWDYCIQCIYKEIR